MWFVIVFWLVLGGVREVREVTDRVACLAALPFGLLLGNTPAWRDHLLNSGFQVNVLWGMLAAASW